MYCPLCGNKLSEVEREPRTNLGVDEFAEEICDEAVWFECKAKGCFGPTFPLEWHHPYKGTTSAPGDSWSLTWLE